MGNANVGTYRFLIMRIAIMVDPLFFMMSRGESCVNKNSMSRKLAMAGILTALAVVGSLIEYSGLRIPSFR